MNYFIKTTKIQVNIGLRRESGLKSHRLNRYNIPVTIKNTLHVQCIYCLETHQAINLSSTVVFMEIPSLCSDIETIYVTLFHFYIFVFLWITKICMGNNSLLVYGRQT